MRIGYPLTKLVSRKNKQSLSDYAERVRLSELVGKIGKDRIQFY